ncbi:MAG: SIS domain-containing protein [Candidatus Buchananbacteria bacterium]|nr:SIS domain-containing protein [Candidatus Buchananbacteria bacterium]
MKILDDLKTIQAYSKSKVSDTISFLPDQISQSWQDISKFKWPKNYSHFQNIVVCGMGGSNLATELARSIYSRDIKIPFVLVRDYHLPQFVNSQTLAIISSYSGNTEETLSCFKEAREKKAKIFCLASGGKLITGAKKHNIPYYQINKKYNPSHQPRYGLGLQLGAILSLLNRVKIIKVSSKEIEQSCEYLSILNQSLTAKVDSANNFAKKLAAEFEGQLPILVAADFLSANVHILANQINESAKNIIQYYKIPELNHHLLEGLKMPTAISSKIKFLFLNSNLYSAIISRRFYVTEKVLKNQKIKFIDYSVSSDSKLLTALEVLLLGSWVSYYLTILNQQNPTSIPWVNFFKKELAK